MESEFIPFVGDVNPTTRETIVQLKLSNDNEPIEKAGTFHWGFAGRGTTYPTIESWREATQEEYNEYQERKARKRKELVK